MKLLVFTQKVDLDDTVLAFFHRWILELAKHCERLTVVCLYKGRHELPPAVRVFSLGKETGRSRVKYVRNFFRSASLLKDDYDSVFVHMNQEYVLLGGFYWKSLGKKIFMWRNHYAGSLLTDAAALFCDKVFCTSKYSYTAKYAKTVLMPVGVDTEVFKPIEGVRRMEHSILSLGRISPSKKIEQLIEALAILKKQGSRFVASIYGDALPPDAGYYRMLKEKARELELDDRLSFKPGVPNRATPAIYSAHDIFVNLSPSGMFDKTIFEAMASGTIIVSSNRDLADKIDAEYLFEENDVGGLAARISGLLAIRREERDARGERLRKYAAENHGLGLLAKRLALEMSA
ncbi:MAG: hypothetical protein QOG91_144 [Candidatus Parcubacteria bacterium]|jgi:glycosyltransferase involved in cell wall biosynthesis|nr:hypothetical protein [Candidatus Parcubacteria bacterium]